MKIIKVKVTPSKAIHAFSMNNVLVGFFLFFFHFFFHFFKIFKTLFHTNVDKQIPKTHIVHLKWIDNDYLCKYEIDHKNED